MLSTNSQYRQQRQANLKNAHWTIESRLTHIQQYPNLELNYFERAKIP